MRLIRLTSKPHQRSVSERQNAGVEPWRYEFPIQLQAKQAWLKDSPSPIEDRCVDAVFDLIRTIYVVYQLRKLLSKLPERVIDTFVYRFFFVAAWTPSSISNFKVSA